MPRSVTAPLLSALLALMSSSVLAQTADQPQLAYAAAAPRQPTILSGSIDTVARAQAMMQQVEQAIVRGERLIHIESPGGLTLYGWLIGDLLREATVKVRCIGWCASTTVQILVASRGCVVSRRARVLLHAPQISNAALSVTEYARVDKLVVDGWRQRMAQFGVPNDLLDRAMWARDRRYELSDYDMKRIGCEVE
jgi:ATP-dependent protease ClpP protease subunit